MTARDVIASVEEYHAVSGPERLGDLMAEKIISKLSADGYSIVHESEIHGATRERCIAALAKANTRIPGIETPCMKGDNFAILLCTFFDDGDRETEDDTGWSKAARDGYEEVITAIRDHYTGSLRALPDGGVAVDIGHD